MTCVWREGLKKTRKVVSKKSKRKCDKKEKEKNN